MSACAICRGLQSRTRCPFASTVITTIASTSPNATRWCAARFEPGSISKRCTWTFVRCCLCFKIPGAKRPGRPTRLASSSSPFTAVCPSARFGRSRSVCAGRSCRGEVSRCLSREEWCKLEAGQPMQQITTKTILRVLVIGFALVTALLLAAGFFGVKNLQAIKENSASLVEEQLVTTRLIDEVQREQGTLSAVFYHLEHDRDSVDRAGILLQLDEADNHIGRIVSS